MPKKAKPKTIAEVADILRALIEAGEFQQGLRLPPSGELATKYDTSRDTVNRAIKQLQSEGYLASRGPNTRGVIVSHSRMFLSGITPRFDLEIKKRGLDPFEENIDEVTIIPSSKEIAKILNVQEGTFIVRRFRKQGIIQEKRKIPYRLAENFYSTKLVDNEILKQVKYDDRFDVIQAIKEKHNKIIENVHEDITVRLPKLQERELLEITPQTSILEIKRISYAEDKTVIMANTIILIANIFTLSYDYPVYHWKK